MDKLIANIIDLMKIKSISGRQEEIKKALNWVKSNYVTDGIFVSEWEFENASPVMLLANCEGYDFDVATIGHLDVVPAKDELFEPKIDGNRLYGRGGLDMKASVVVCLETLRYTLGKNIRFGVLITTDEETSSGGMKAMQKADIISAKTVLDTDSGSLYNLVEKYKHPVSVELTGKGENAHSSRPWEGVNAVNALIDMIHELEKTFPRYEKGKAPQTTWIDTMAVTAFNSPTTYNVVPDTATARLSFRLTEKTSLPELEKILQQAADKHGCDYNILLSSQGVYMDASAPAIQQYLKIAEKIVGRKIEISTNCGATDSRIFANKSTIIMHSINGENMHGDNEYAEIDSILTLAEIQKAFVDSLLKA